MSSRHPLRQTYYQESIHLNDRPYGLLDIGDGACKVILVAGINEADYSKNAKLGRRIIIDISKAWGHGSQLLTKQELEQLADDIHLLLDVFWLDCVIFDTTLDGLDLSFIEKRLAVRQCGEICVN
ncbi:hypothetical protein [Vibrio sp. McD22-P3]|uniref:hypothetical protein n=1 Tax=Vibrio sp. McD22-P3 TaxID=2724880 RepID=UPI001F4473CD|nr:hypothetical protein [Vibrio sp. McD22-P3]MCF4173159.1 hypothetical protein [Vibrio sp. McD22-P3]